MKFTSLSIIATLALTSTALRAEEKQFTEGDSELTKLACDGDCYNQCFLDWCITPDPFGNLSCIIACSDICGCL
ncbi:hypothetical protein B0T11DRAFT_329621 [Plectosphaerella cucumerina]|uniref:Uncharacterized protein n=1 Tax=Plectosphaerella cucumerina TaxID=40658 RepID=A0A8K0T7H8_9PEZI|nr:hypothetical protein B0T11DRAFT_329621 [Plectosphaerella cucumerina]